MGKERQITIGDKVNFGAFGVFDDEKVYRVVDKTPSVIWDSFEYLLSDDNGHLFTAFCDEIGLIL